jgi:AraC-like DNA-binding protein
LRIDTFKNNILPHGHDFIEFTYAIEGFGIESVNGIEHELIPGTFTLLFPHQIHEIKVNPEKAPVLYVCEIGLNALWDTSDSMLLLNDLLFNVEKTAATYYRLNSETASQILSLLQQMYEEFKSDMPWSRTMFKADLVKLLILFDRHRISLQNESYPKNITKSNSKMRDIIRYVYCNFREDITLESLSKQFYLSAPYISYAFKQLIGEKFHSLLENMRLAQACSLLMSSDMPVTDIAYEVGFKSYKTFSRVFSTQIKMTPREYRNNFA